MQTPPPPLSPCPPIASCCFLPLAWKGLGSLLCPCTVAGQITGVDPCPEQNQRSFVIHYTQPAPSLFALLYFLLKFQKEEQEGLQN